MDLGIRLNSGRVSIHFRVALQPFKELLAVLLLHRGHGGPDLCAVTLRQGRPRITAVAIILCLLDEPEDVAALQEINRLVGNKVVSLRAYSLICVDQVLICGGLVRDGSVLEYSAVYIRITRVPAPSK